VIARKTGSLWETTNGRTADRQALRKYFAIYRNGATARLYCPRPGIRRSAVQGNQSKRPSCTFKSRFDHGAKPNVTA
jgi:hypothetical protein